MNIKILSLGESVSYRIILIATPKFTLCNKNIPLTKKWAYNAWLYGKIAQQTNIFKKGYWALWK